MALSPDGTRLAFSREKSVELRDMRSGKVLHRWPIPGTVLWDWLTFSGDGRTLAYSDNSNAVRIWDSHSRRQLLYLDLDYGSTCAALLSPDGKLVITGGDKVRIYDTATRQLRRVLVAPPPNERLSTFVMSADGGTVAVVYIRHPPRSTIEPVSAVTVWDVPSGNLLRTLKPQHLWAETADQAPDLALSPDGDTLATIHTLKAGNNYIKSWVELWRIR